MEGVVLGFLKQGVLGLIVITLGIVIQRLWTKYDEIQEKRIKESKESRTALEQNTSALQALAETIRSSRRD